MHVAYLMLVSCLAYSLIIKMEAIYFSETSVNFDRTTRCDIPQDRTLFSLRSSLSAREQASHAFKSTGLSVFTSKTLLKIDVSHSQ
jgi:hypothetical protein